MFTQRVRLSLVLVFGLAVAAPAADPAKPEVELTVTASSATTTITKGGENAEPVTLTFTFKNVSGKELTLDATQIELRMLSLKVTGPDGKAVPATHDTSELVVGKPARPVPQLKKLAAGDAWEMTKSVPGLWSSQLGAKHLYVLATPGTYKISAVYNGTHAEQDAWHGTTTSKEIELKVVEK